MFDYLRVKTIAHTEHSLAWKHAIRIKPPTIGKATIIEFICSYFHSYLIDSVAVKVAQDWTGEEIFFRHSIRKSLHNRPLIILFTFPIQMIRHINAKLPCMQSYYVFIAKHIVVIQLILYLLSILNHAFHFRHIIILLLLFYSQIIILRNIAICETCGGLPNIHAQTN